MIEQLRTVHSYICIAAFHLGMIDEPREGCDIEAETEDGEWWTHLEDGWIPMCMTEGRCSPSEYHLTNTDSVLIPGKPRCTSYYLKL